MTQQSSKSYVRTLQDLNDLASSDYIKSKKFDDFSIRELEQMKSDDLRHLYKKN